MKQALSFCMFIFFLSFIMGFMIEKSGVELWSDNCGRCHNIKPPTSYKNAEWDVIGLHMKTRANIPSEDIKKIIEFLKRAN